MWYSCSFSVILFLIKNNPISASEAGKTHKHPVVHKLDFVLTPEIIQAIENATIQFQKLASSLHTGIFNSLYFSLIRVGIEHFIGYGKKWIMKQKLSPDALVQVAFQVCQYRITGKVKSYSILYLTIKAWSDIWICND